MIFKYEHEGKTKTFENKSQIDLFTGASVLYQGEFEYQAVSVPLFYKIKAKGFICFTYDDGSEIEASEWVECVIELMMINE